jgi:hypothetical protein
LEVIDLRAATVGRPLEVGDVTPVNPARSQKGRPMWTYDGEQWIEEGANDKERKTDRTQRPEEMYQPEMQVIEIVPVPVPKTNYVPPLPMP